MSQAAEIGTSGFVRADTDTAPTGDVPVTQDVSGIVLAGGQTWDRSSLEKVVPKTMAPIVNRPLMMHALEWLHGGGIRQASICGADSAHAFRTSLQENAWTTLDGLRIDYYVDAAPRGPAGCIRDAGLGCSSSVFVAVEGAIVPRLDLSAMIQAHHRSGAALTVAVTTTADKNGSMHENLSPRGIYIFARRALQHVPSTGYQDIKESLIPRLYQCGESVLTYRTDAPLLRVTGVDSYLAVHEWTTSFLPDDHGHFAEYEKRGETRMHPTANISETARMIGPILIGPGSEVGPGATIVGPTTVGRGSVIGENSVVCRSSIWDDALIQPEAVLDRCVVTNGAVVSRGVRSRYEVLSDSGRRFSGIRGRNDR